MPWNASGGFTTGAPWFGYAPGLATDNVARETDDPSSLLSYYRNWITTRKQSPALRSGDLTVVDSGFQILAFIRHSGDERVLVLHNVSASTIDSGPLAVNADGFDRVHADPGVSDPSGTTGAWHFTMPPHTSAVWRLK